MPKCQRLGECQLALHGGGREQARANPVLRPEPCAHLPELGAKQEVGAPKLNLCEALPTDDEQKHSTLLKATKPSSAELAAKLPHGQL